MMFSAMDIPIQASNPFGELVDLFPEIMSENPRLSKDQIADLIPRIDYCVDRTKAALDGILQYDLRWRTSVFQGKTEYDPAIETRIQGSLKAWLDAMESLLVKLDALKPFGLDAKSLDIIRPTVYQVRSMLTPDDQFFEGEELDEIAAGAVEEFEDGKTLEFQVMGE